MANVWTTIPTSDVDVDSPLTTGLMTALRDNPEGIAQRASGAPKIFGTPYNVQVFPASGTWTKPSNAETGDVVIVWGVGGGASGARDADASDANGGNGGVGALWRIDDIDDLGATEPVTIGAGAGVNTSGDGSDGGDTIFGTSGNVGYCNFQGGNRGLDAVSRNDQQFIICYSNEELGNVTVSYEEGEGGHPDRSATTANAVTGGMSHYGGGGGGNGQNAGGGFSAVGGHGGAGGNLVVGRNGSFPGGGGGGARDANGGAGADGYMIVYCIKEL